MPQPNYLVIILVVAGILIITSFTPLIRKLKIQKYCLSVFALVLFLYTFFGRQIIYIYPDIYGGSGTKTIVDSLRLSRIFLLDLCPFFALIGPIFIFMRQKTASGVLSAFGFFGAAVTVFGELIFYPPQTDVVRFLFIGSGNNQIYFMMHYLSLLLSLAVLLWDNSISLRSFFYGHVFALAYFGYIMLVLTVFNTQIISNTTGILKADWLAGGEYQNVAKFLKLDPNNYELIFGVGFAISYVAIFILILLGNIPVLVKMRFEAKQYAMPKLSKTKSTKIKKRLVALT